MDRPNDISRQRSKARGQASVRVLWPLLEHLDANGFSRTPVLEAAGLDARIVSDAEARVTHEAAIDALRPPFAPSWRSTSPDDRGHPRVVVVHDPRAHGYVRCTAGGAITHARPHDLSGYGRAFGDAPFSFGHERSELAFPASLLSARMPEADAELHETTFTAAEIAFLLGYSEPSVFHRAFRRWTGQTPQSFRETAQRTWASKPPSPFQ